MKIYIKDKNVYWQYEPFIDADAEFEVNVIQEEILRNGGTADFRDGQIVIIPKAPEILEQSSSKVITKRAFLSRLTAGEYATIKSAANINATLDYYWSMFMVSDEIDLSFADTINGVNMMEQAGLIAQGRAMEILN